MKKLKIGLVAFSMFTAFVSTTIIAPIAAGAATVANFMFPWWKVIWAVIEILIPILKKEFHDMVVGGGTSHDVDMNPILRNPDNIAGLASEGIIVNSQSITFSQDYPVMKEDSWGVIIPRGTYNIQPDGRCILDFRKILLPSPTFPEPFPPQDY